MAALTGPRYARLRTIKTKMFPLKAGATAYVGGAAAADTTGNSWVQPATPQSGLLNIGQFENNVNNSSNTATSFANVTLAREITIFYYDNATGANAVTAAANLFTQVYFQDDHTVTTYSAGGNLIAGRVWDVDAMLGVGIQPTQL